MVITYIPTGKDRVRVLGLANYGTENFKKIKKIFPIVWHPETNELGPRCKSLDLELREKIKDGL